MPVGRKLDAETLFRLINPWADADDTAPSGRGLREKVMAFNAGLKGAGTRRKKVVR